VSGVVTVTAFLSGSAIRTLNEIPKSDAREIVILTKKVIGNVLQNPKVLKLGSIAQ